MAIDVSNSPKITRGQWELCLSVFEQLPFPEAKLHNDAYLQKELTNEMKPGPSQGTNDKSMLALHYY